MTQKPTPINAPTQPRRHVRRQTDTGHFIGPGPGILLAFEDTAKLQSIRQSVQDRLGAEAPVELVVAELLTASAWRGMRSECLLASCLDTELQDRAEAVNREYASIDDYSRTALTFHDPNIARLARHFERSANECQRALRQAFPMRAIKTHS
jgi:hypothetical protein